VEHAVDLVAGQADDPGENVVVGPLRVVAVEVAEGQDQGFLHDFLAQVAVAADAIQAEAVQRFQQGVGQRLHGGGVPAEGARAPVGIEDGSQAGPPFRLPREAGRGTMALLHRRIGAPDARTGIPLPLYVRGEGKPFAESAEVRLKRSSAGWRPVE
jgi:hypothetical protein